MEKNKIEDTFTKSNDGDYAFILSYGTGKGLKDLIPVGYFVSRQKIFDVIFKDAKVEKEPLTGIEKSCDAYCNGKILFINEFNLNQIIALSVNSCAKVFYTGASRIDGYNNSKEEFGILLDEYSFDTENMPYITGIPMNKLDATWCTDANLGENYSIVPVKVKKD